MKLINQKTPAAQLIEQEIERFGPMNFAKFVELALYHPVYGYYSRKAPRGRAGDYFTAGQVSDLFPKIIAEGISQMMATMNSEQFSIIEVGAGFGELLEGVLESLKDMGRYRGVKVWAVERSVKARDELWRRLSRFSKLEIISSLNEIEMVGGLEGLIYSNELFDALPFHRYRYHESGWKEICIAIEKGHLTEEEISVSDQTMLSSLNGIKFEEGQEIELRPKVKEIYEEWSAQLQRGYILTLDYGYPRKELYSPIRPRGTWLCYHRHKVNQTPFMHLGEQDITAHVDFSQLARIGQDFGFSPAFFGSQGIFLSHIGKEVIEKILKAEGSQSARIAQAIQQLIHPDGMGEKFSVLLQTKEADLPPAFQRIPNRVI